MKGKIDFTRRHILFSLTWFTEKWAWAFIALDITPHSYIISQHDLRGIRCEWFCWVHARDSDVVEGENRKTTQLKWKIEKSSSWRTRNWLFFEKLSAVVETHSNKSSERSESVKRGRKIHQTVASSSCIFSSTSNKIKLMWISDDCVKLRTFMCREKVCDTTEENMWQFIRKRAEYKVRRKIQTFRV